MRYFSLSLAAALVLSLSSLSFAQPAATNQTDIQKYIQMHENMIKINQDAIACLKSGKTITDCRNQFHQTMKKQMMKGGSMHDGMMGCGCPMMQKHMNGHMMHGQMHNDMSNDMHNDNMHY